MNYSAQDHVFAVCAYGESPYLEECIRSLEGQTVKSRIVVCTATPNEHIKGIAAAHGLDVIVNKGPHGIAEDWNFAYKHAGGELVTLAHQDDLYRSDYTQKILRKAGKARHPLILFTDYFEIRNGEYSYWNTNVNLLVKKIGQLPLRIPRAGESRFAKRMVLAFGDMICCPSVTFVRKNLPKQIFQPHFQANLDWQAWERLSKHRGEFCYIPEALMGHRIHAESATTKVIGKNHSRSAEDLEMYRRFWPEWMAQLLNRIYSLSQNGNELE